MIKMVKKQQVYSAGILRVPKYPFLLSKINCPNLAIRAIQNVAVNQLFFAYRCCISGLLLEKLDGRSVECDKFWMAKLLNCLFSPSSPPPPPPQKNVPLNVVLYLEWIRNNKFFLQIICFFQNLLYIKRCRRRVLWQKKLHCPSFFALASNDVNRNKILHDIIVTWNRQWNFTFN